MSPKKPECRNPGKKKFKTEDEAVRFALRLLKDRPNIKPQYAYVCECGSWHLTKQKQDKKLVVFTGPEPSLEKSRRMIAIFLDTSVFKLIEMGDKELIRLLVGKDDS